VSFVPVSEEGVVSPKAVRELVGDETILVSVMYVQNEVGAIQPVREIAREVRRARRKRKSVYPLFHIDACQAAGFFDLHAARLGADLISVSGRKIGGPRGAGVLFRRRGTPLSPILFGGGQEGGMRAGTENVPAAAGMAAAMREAAAARERAAGELAELRADFIAALEKQFPDCVIHAKESGAPHILSTTFPECESEELALRLDARGIAASTGSACKSSAGAVSYVLSAMYGGGAPAEGAVRFSFGKETNERDISRALAALRHTVPLCRAEKRSSGRESGEMEK